MTEACHTGSCHCGAVKFEVATPLDEVDVYSLPYEVANGAAMSVVDKP